VGGVIGFAGFAGDTEPTKTYSSAQQLWSLAIVGLTVDMVGWQHVYVRQGFGQYMDPGGHPSGN